MSTNNDDKSVQKVPELLTFKDMMLKDEVQLRFREMLREKAQPFITSALQLVHANEKLKKCDPVTVLTAISTAASLGLNIDPNFGFCYIIPYNITQPDRSKKMVAQFQMGYKGLIQLGQRSGQYKSIIGLPVYENQFISWDPLFENFQADFSKPGEGKIHGFVAAFELLNGFKKVAYWTYQEVHLHAKKYSKSYGRRDSLWKDDFGEVAMGVKTVLRRILSKFGPMEVDSAISRAIIADQSVQLEEGKFQYIDRTGKGYDPESADYEKERNRLIAAIEACATVEELQEYSQYVDEFDVANEYDDRQLTIEAEADGSK